MDAFRNTQNSLSHDLVFDGSQDFHNKILSEDYHQQFFIEYPFPVLSPLQNLEESRIKLSLNNIRKNHRKRQIQRELKKVKTKICRQNFQNYAILPSFLVNYIENKNRVLDYDFILDCSSGVLEKFYSQNELCLIRPNLDNNLAISRPETAEESITIEWLCQDPILSIENMEMENSNNFIVRGKNSICLVEIDNHFRTEVKEKLNCNIGYLDTSLNFVNKSELAIVDTKNKVKLFDLNNRKISCSYVLKNSNINSKPKITRTKYLNENILMIMNDKEIKLLDTRCKESPKNIEIQLENCDIMLNFTTNFVNDVYIASKHTYFIYDCRMTCVQDFIHHNLRSPPCFINYFEGRGMKMVTLFSQSPNENAIFGGMSPYSLPYHLSNLKDSYDRCRSQKNIPVIPHIEDRLNFPTAGVQLVSNIDGMSIYFTNIFGEIFCQDIILQPSQSEKPIEKMHHWVTEIDGKNDPGLNIVHQANASSAFNLNTDFNDIDLFDHYEKCNINEFLEDEDFDYTKWKSETFLEIWGDAEDEEMKSLLQLKPTLSKVEDWIESTKFEIKEDLDDAQKH